jgi:hypothetical protein
MADVSTFEVEAMSLGENAAQSVGCPAGKADTTIAPKSLDHRPGSSCSDLQYRENKRPTQLQCICPSCPWHGKQTKLPDSPGEEKLEEFMRRSALYMINTSRRPF